MFDRQLRRLAQAHNSRNIFRAGAAIAFVVTAVEDRLEFRAGADVQRAHALRPVNLVRRNRKQIHAQAVDVQRQFPRALHRVAVEVNVLFRRDAADLFDRLDRANFVVRQHHADEHRFRTDSLANIIGIDDAVVAC